MLLGLMEKETFHILVDLTKNNKKVLGNYRKLWNEIKK